MYVLELSNTSIKAWLCVVLGTCEQLKRRPAVYLGKCVFQDTTDAFPCHNHLPVCLWIMGHYSRAAKTNTSHGNEVLPQDTTNLMKRPRYQRGSLCQDPAGNRTTRRPPDHSKDTQIEPVHQVWSKPSRKAQWKGEEDKADRKRGVKTTSGNGQAWMSAKSQRAVENREKGRKLIVVKSSVVPRRPLRLRDKWRRRSRNFKLCSLVPVTIRTKVYHLTAVRTVLSTSLAAVAMASKTNTFISFPELLLL